MTAVVDTNVIAYYLLGTQPFASEAARFWREVVKPIAPAVWEAEFANVVWMATRSGIIDLEGGQEKLRLARKLGVRSVSSRSLWQGAYVRAVQSGVAAYDTLFVELAARRSLKLATFDRRILSRFPSVAVRPARLAKRGAV